MAICPKGHKCLHVNWCDKCISETFIERRRTCDHVDEGTIFVEGLFGGTIRTRCAWCETLLHDTLWDMDFEEDE